MSDPGHEREHAHDVTVLVRPSLRITVAFDLAGSALEACSLSFDYDRRGLVDVPDVASSGQEIELRGYELDVYHNGERLFDRGLDVDTSDVLGYIDDLALFASRLSRRLR